MTKITYFVHGTTTDNEVGLATGWLPGKLSKLGIQQSKELPQLVKDLSFSVVYCSDLKRAIDSANFAFGATHKIIIDKRLREANYGNFDGKNKKFKKDMTNFINNPYPAGESYAEIEKRIRDFVKDIKAEPDKHIAIVAHEAPQLALEVIANNQTWEQAIKNNWRDKKAWQPGWIYKV
jgi:broad specificity phosphatase PhoE